VPYLTTDLSRERWQPFRCDVEPERGSVRVVPHGELDMATCPELERHLRELRESGFDRVVLDLRRLTFMDSTGLRAILSEDATARVEGRTFTLIAGPPAVQRTFEVACVAERLPFSTPGY
jgi:anti-sigma B factor antagonist